MALNLSSHSKFIFVLHSNCSIIAFLVNLKWCFCFTCKSWMGFLQLLRVNILVSYFRYIKHSNPASTWWCYSRFTFISATYDLFIHLFISFILFHIMFFRHPGALFAVFFWSLVRSSVLPSPIKISTDRFL